MIEDKTPEMKVWVNELKKITDKGVKTYAFFNNHYAGFSPGSVKQFEDLGSRVRAIGFGGFAAKPYTAPYARVWSN